MEPAFSSTWSIDEKAVSRDDRVMKHCGSLETQGGPILLVDADAASSWGGVETADYSKLIHACGPEGCELTVGGGRAVAWEPEGGGIIEVFADEVSAVLCKIMALDPDESRDVAVLNAAVARPVTSAVIGSVDICSGKVAIFWSPVSGREIARPRMVGEKAVMLSVGIGRFVCGTEQHQTPRSEVWCCRIVREQQSP
ncbi:MAG TPA: hypothetical protein VGH20_14855 [Myxococcales bacterium]|jgi:hypothetical protein